MKPRLRAIVVVEYEADPQHYPSEDIREMAALDERSYREDPTCLLDCLWLTGDEITEITVEPVFDEEF